MRTLWKSITHYYQMEEQLIIYNREEVDRINQTMLHRMLLIAMGSFIILFFVSFISNEYYPLRKPYGCMLMFFLLNVLLCRRLIRYIPVVAAIYFYYGTFLLYCMYTSAYINPQFTSVMILALLFEVPMITLDKGWRVNLFEIGCMLIYMIGVIPHKQGEVRIDELMNGILFMSIALCLGHSLRKIKLENFELRRQAIIREHTDFLTGLENRRSLFSKLGQIESDQQGEWIGILMLDVDCFKQYNDTYGHQIGDACLRQLGIHLQKISKDYPITFYRYGGEEFVGITRGCQEQELLNICHIINQSIYDLKLPHRKGAYPFVTVSIGTSLSNDPTDGYKKLLSQADLALYWAKKSGRHQTALFTESIAPDLEKDMSYHEKARE